MLVKSRVVPNLCDLLLQNTRRYLKNVWRTLWRTIFLSMQWNSKGFKITLDHIDTYSMDKNVLCSIAEIKSFMFGTTCGRVNDEFIFGWTIPLNCWRLKEALSPPWGLRLAITMFDHAFASMYLRRVCLWPYTLYYRNLSSLISFHTFPLLFDW